MMRKMVVLINREGLGHVAADDKRFGIDMLDRFLHTLESQPSRPQAICLYTDGVKLVCEGSPVVFSLKLLHGMGVRLLVCRTCLEHYGLMDKVAVGEVAGMNDIVGLMAQADCVLTV